MRELDALQKQQNRKNFACQGAGKLTGLGLLLHNSQCCSAPLAHACPTMFYIPPSIMPTSIHRGDHLNFLWLFKECEGVWLCVLVLWF